MNSFWLDAICFYKVFPLLSIRRSLSKRPYIILFFTYVRVYGPSIERHSKSQAELSDRCVWYFTGRQIPLHSQTTRPPFTIYTAKTVARDYCPRLTSLI